MAKTRAEKILEVYQAYQRPLTDREVLNDLHLPDMNCVRPRITELISDGNLRRVGDAEDELTKTKVRLVTVAVREPTQAQLPGMGGM